jgi:hypothetical protein
MHLTLHRLSGLRRRFTPIRFAVLSVRQAVSRLSRFGSTADRLSLQRTAVVSGRNFTPADAGSLGGAGVATAHPASSRSEINQNELAAR